MLIVPLVKLFCFCRDGTLTSVVGSLRDFENRAHVLVYCVSPVTNWNELTYHLLDVMLIHLQNTKGPIPVS